MDILKFVKCSWKIILLVLFCIAVAGYFGNHPNDYNAACQVLITLITAVSFAFAGFAIASDLSIESDKQEFKMEENKVVFEFT